MPVYTPQPLVEQLDDEHIEFQLIHHRRTETAAAEAAELGVDPEHVAKTVILTTPTALVRAVLPASERLDLHKVREFLGTNDVELATEEVLAGAYPEFELGAIPPFGGPRGDRVLIDVRLLAHPTLVAEAGTHDSSIRFESADLIELENTLIADIARD